MPRPESSQTWSFRHHDRVREGLTPTRLRVVVQRLADGDADAEEDGGNEQRRQRPENAAPPHGS